MPHVTATFPTVTSHSETFLQATTSNGPAATHRCYYHAGSAHTPLLLGYTYSSPNLLLLDRGDIVSM